MKSLETAAPFASSPLNARQNSPVRRIFLVDDHPVTRSGIAALLGQQSSFQICGETDSAPKAVELISKINPDLAIVDISLKTTSGIELIKNLSSLVPGLKLLVLSMHDESLYAERALRAGAKGYVMKDQAHEVLITAVRRIFEGELYLSDKMKERMLNRFVSHKRDELTFSIDSLSDRELEVLGHIGNGYSTRQIAAKLNLSVKTIDSYREHLKIKLHLAKGADLVRHAIQWVKSEELV
ncbi:MAG: response regulator transcription factor [Nibricoccus sp.]